jgi:hypothetical protein
MKRRAGGSKQRVALCGKVERLGIAGFRRHERAPLTQEFPHRALMLGDALVLAAREFVRPPVEHLIGFEPNSAERVADMTLADIATRDAGDPQRLGNDVADATARV